MRLALRYARAALAFTMYATSAGLIIAGDLFYAIGRKAQPSGPCPFCGRDHAAEQAETEADEPLTTVMVCAECGFTDDSMPRWDVCPECANPAPHTMH